MVYRQELAGWQMVEMKVLAVSFEIDESVAVVEAHPHLHLRRAVAWWHIPGDSHHLGEELAKLGNCAADAADFPPGPMKSLGERNLMGQAHPHAQTGGV